MDILVDAHGDCNCVFVPRSFASYTHHSVATLSENIRGTQGCGNQCQKATTV